MNNKQKKLYVYAAFLTLFLLVALVSCPTSYDNFPVFDEIILITLEEDIQGKVVKIIEAEDGTFTRSPNWTNGQETPTIFRNSGVASGGAYIKGIGYLQGWVDMTVPKDLPAATYSLALRWSGSASGKVKVTLNPGLPSEQAVDKSYTRPNGENEWEMADPQHLPKVFDNTEFKAGDIIRVHNSGPGDSGQWMHLDAVILYTPN